jgi:hypothetical protein
MELAENSIDAAPSPVVGRPFAPGVSGNPGGRPEGLAREFAWTDWTPLAKAPSHDLVPRFPGLYRVRRCGSRELDYIGQTGTTLRRRLAMLRFIYAAEMPYDDQEAPVPWSAL